MMWGLWGQQGTLLAWLYLSRSRACCALCLSDLCESICLTTLSASLYSLYLSYTHSFLL